MLNIRCSHLLFLSALLFAGLLPAWSDADSSKSLAIACAAFGTFKRTNLYSAPEPQADDIIRLCGGRDTIAAGLTPLLSDPSAHVRRDAAATLGFRDNLLEDGDENYASTTAERQKAEAANGERFRRFNESAIPALAVCVQDKDIGVRLAALQSLEALTWNSQNAPWSAAVAPVSQAIASKDPVLRLAALRVLAYMPTDVSPAAASLRLGLHGTEEERNYAMAALIHAGQTNRSATLDVFLTALKSTNLMQHKQAADDIRQATMPLWTGDFWMQYPLPNWWNDSRLSIFSTNQIMSIPPSQTPVQLQQRQAATAEAQPRLLAALAKLAADPNHEVRRNAVLGLEQINKWTYRLLGCGFSPNLGMDDRLQEEEALTQAAANLPLSEHSLAKRLRVLHDRLAVGPQSIY